MSKFISLRILATLSKSKKLSTRETPKPPTVESANEPRRDEPTSSSRISVNRIRVDH